MSELGDVNRYLTEPLNRVLENYMNASAQISLSLCIVWGIVYLLLCWHIRHRGLFVALTLAGLVVTWFVCLGALNLYFELTIARATTEAEVAAVVGGDSAKLVFTALFFGPAASVLLAFLGTFVYLVQRICVQFRAPSEADMQTQRPTHSNQLDSPSYPPTSIHGG